MRKKSAFGFVFRCAWILIAFFFSTNQTAVAQGTTGKIAGRVTDALTGEGLPGASVVIKARIEDGQEITLSALQGSTTDEEGRYFILNVRPGTYAIQASFVGFQSQIKSPIRVQVGLTASVDFELGEATFEGEEVVVVAERSMITVDLTSSSSKISGDDLDNLPVETLADAIQIQAGVTTDLGGGLHIRGGRSSEIQYYVDGIAIANPFNNALAVPVENNAIEELEVISGTFNAEYGQALSGIVNIVTKEGSEKFIGNFSAQVGDYISTSDDVFFNIDDIDPVAQRDFEGFLSGPIIPGRVSFFVSGRVSELDNWLAGQRRFLPSDSASFAGNNPDEWLLPQSGNGEIVPMNPSTSYSGQAKITARLTNTLKLSYNLLANRSEGRAYNHFFKLNPDAVPTGFTNSFNHIVKIDHTLGQRSFYTLSLAYYQNDFERYVYEDPLDSRYASLFGRGSQPSNVFSTGGLAGDHLYRNSNTYAGRLDFSSQVNHSNLIKGGIEVRYHDLNEEFLLIDVDPNRYGSFTPQIPPLTSVSHNQFTRNPIEIAAYIQDKIEIQDLIVNIGVRFDYFDAQADQPTDFTDPANRIFPRDPSEAFRKVGTKTQISPRLGLAFPITERGVIHASYGQFFQIPEFARLYENPEFEVVGNVSSFLGNANLDAQRTDMYEIGVQQQLTDFMAVDITMFYRDVRNLLGSELFETIRGEIYGRYANTDFGSVRGVTVAADIALPQMGFSAGFDYTYQVAKGVASDPRQAFFDVQGRSQSAVTLLPLNWDLRHSLNVFLNYGKEGWGGSLITRANSGFPFTPTEFIRRSALIELRNGARYRGTFAVDVRAFKQFKVGRFRPEFYVKVENLFDSIRRDFLPRIDPLEIDAHNNTGLDIVNTREEFALNPSVQPVPREIKVGFELSF
ncbi:MAG: TonB-dependent receptor [Rhodothermaceae bacterium]|nr:TonB-dependent receptor [Rhodothermaceae bacterium]